MSTSHPNIKDVAREADCSIATVSLVLNDRGRIGKATRARVRQACKKLGYYPRAAGRNLRRRRSETIGILFYPSCSHIFRNVFYSKIMEGLEEELTDANQNLTEALLAAQILEPGAYCVMHNKVLQFPGVRKDLERWTFKKVTPKE